MHALRHRAVASECVESENPRCLRAWSWSVGRHGILGRCERMAAGFCLPSTEHFFELAVLSNDRPRANGQERHTAPRAPMSCSTTSGRPHSPCAGSRHRDDGARATSSPRRTCSRGAHRRPRSPWHSTHHVIFKASPHRTLHHSTTRFARHAVGRRLRVHVRDAEGQGCSRQHGDVKY